ncbi:uncharacterized protein LOC135145927 [Zophobas morio]|uniref:uncharacterized protein LOC135145927 n=1 Tax=Zophobas morio TaxID=2755281 RepID=UPI003082B2CE
MGNAPKNLKNLLLTYLYYESQDSEEVKKKLMTLAEDMKDLSWINKKLLRKLKLYKSTQKHRANNHFLSQLLHNFCELFDLVGPPPDTEISLVQKGLSFCEEAILGDNLEKDKSIFKQLTSDDDFKFVEGEGKYYRKRNCVFKEITSGRVFPTDCNKVTSTPNSGGVPMKENFIANNFSYRSSTPLSYKKARLNEKESLSPAAVSLAKFTLNDYTALSLHFNQRSRRHWTSEEIKLLLEGIKANGVGKWSSILSFITLAKPEFNRTSTDLKDKWRNLLNKKDPAALKVMNSTDFSAQLGRNQRKSETSKLLERLDTIKRKAGEALMSD